MGASDGHQLTASLLDPMNRKGMFSKYQISGLFADGSKNPAGLLLFVQNGTGDRFRLGNFLMLQMHNFLSPNASARGTIEKLIAPRSRRVGFRSRRIDT